MHKIIVLWATPRSTSTAFEWMMRQRNDMDCLHEPFGKAWYVGEDPLWHRWQTGDETTPGLTFGSVLRDIQARAEKGPVFVKDFPHYVSHLWTPEFLANFTHAFLIRDPAKSLMSMHSKWPDFYEGEVGFPEQRALFDLLTTMKGAAPPVIDSDDLLENPTGAISQFCDAMGINYVDSALAWEAGGNPYAHTWLEGGSLHANLSQSTRLEPQKNQYGEIRDAPTKVKNIYRRVRPHYEHMHAHRMRFS